jgi:two-component system response regulator MtrA
MVSMRQRILVVDDDPSLAEMLTIVLRGEGFDTAVVGDGTQALTAVRELRPDLVLLDLMLPGMNGIDVCRVLRADSGVPIVMLTAKTDTVDVVLGLESGADDLPRCCPSPTSRSTYPPTRSPAWASRSR